MTDNGRALFSLSSQVAFVTGAASGIGAATAQAFAESGADLALAWYPPDGHDIEPVAERARRAGARVLTFEVDVRRREDIESAVRASVDGFGTLDIMIANAGIARLETVPEDVGEAAAGLVLDVNTWGVWRCFQAAIPHMRRQARGRLLATTSVAGPLQAWVHHSSYAMSKGAITALVHTLAVELGPAGITVNCIAPGVIESPQSLDSVNSLGPDGVAGQADLVPVRRSGTCEDVAAGFVYLASFAASYVNGHTLVIDGGQWLAGSE